jgi:signal peptidase I
VILIAASVLFFVYGYHIGLVDDPREFAYVHVLNDKMNPAIVPGDWALVDRGFYEKEPVKRGDIIWFAAKGEEGEEARQFLRVAGLAGESVAFSASGELMVDGEILTRHLKFAKRDYRLDGKVPEPVKLGASEFYLLGDNRQEARDSRIIGPVSTRSIRGRALSILFPPNRISRLEDEK